MAKRKKSEKEGTIVRVTEMNKEVVHFTIVGTSPYVQRKFSEKAKAEIRAKQAAGGTAKIKKKRSPKDFQQCYEDAQYKPKNGKWPNGAIPATAIRAAMISACRVVDFVMTQAKQLFFIEADGYDKDERTPLIKITKGKPTYFEQALRISNGNPDISARPLWEEGWEAKVRITYDADKFTLEDVTNLLSRAGSQVGIGEGRMASRVCAGLGWGAFKIKGKG